MIIQAIIVKHVPFIQKVACFVVESLDRTSNTVSMWTEEGGIQENIPLEAYNSCKPVSKADEEYMAKRLCWVMKQSDVEIKHRMPKQSQKRANLVAPENIVAEPKVIVQENKPTVSPQEKATPVQEKKPQQGTQKPLSATFTRRKYDRKPRQEKPAKAPQNVPNQQLDFAAALAGMQAKFDLEIKSMLKILEDNGFDLPSAYQKREETNHVKH